MASTKASLQKRIKETRKLLLSEDTSDTERVIFSALLVQLENELAAL